ncbi:ankyrin [Annulohypoxylon moriforme]|nr:ankyrin [Annulohypoxylon moriforme]
MATKTRKISQDTWNLHKDVILSLYLTSDLPMDELVQAMKRDHGFSATASQFETQLKVWNARKNLKRFEWEELFEKIDRLSSQGIQSRVVISDHPVSMNRIHRARRYCNSESHPSKRRRTDTDLSDNVNGRYTNIALIEIQDLNGKWTPYSTEADSEADYNNIQGDFGLNMQLQRVGSNSDQSSLADDNISSLPSLSDASPQFLPFDISFGNLYSAGGDQRFTPPLDISFGDFQLPASQSFLQYEPNAVITLPRTEHAYYPQDLPFEQFEQELMLKGLKLAISPSPLRDSRLLFGTQKSVAIFLHEVVLAMTSKNKESHKMSFGSVLATLDKLETIIPRGQQSRENSSMVQSIQGKSDVDLQRLLLLSAANGFIGMDDIPIGAVVRFLCQSSNVTSLLTRVFQEVKSPVARSLAENLFRAAIEACDHQKTSLFLQTGLVDVNNTLCFVDGRKLTPIERAAQLQGLSVVHELLKFNADVNRTVDTKLNYRSGYDYQALGLLIGGRCLEYGKREHAAFQQEYLDAVDALIRAGAEIDDSFISAALERFVDMNLAKKLIDRLTPSLHSKIMSERILTSIVEEFSDEDAKRIIAKIFLDCEQTGCGTCMKACSTIDTVVINGAKRGYVQLVQFLFPYADSQEGVLNAAIRGGNRELIDFLLAQDIDIRHFSRKTMDTDGYYTTPLAEAIVLGDEGLVETLENQIAFESISNTVDLVNQITPVLVAAAKIGNLSYLKKLFSLLPDGYNYENGNIFVAAVKNQREDILQFLLEIGLPGAYGFRDDVLEECLMGMYKWENKAILPDLMSKIPNLEFVHFPYSLRECTTPGDVEVVNFCCKSGLASTKFLNDCLPIAIKCNDSSLFHFLLKHGANPRYSYALRAAAKGHLDFLRILLEHTTFINDNWNPPILVMDIIDASNTEALDIFLDNDKAGLRLLRKNVDILSKVIRKDADGSDSSFPLTSRILDGTFDINDYDRRGDFTPLIMAIHTRNKDMVQFLLDYGAKVNKEAIYGVRQTPLQAAAQVGSLEIVELLLRNGAVANDKAALRLGGTALQYAAMSGNCNIAATLVQHGADVWAPPSEFNGRWPIEAAAEHGRIDMIQFLWNLSIFGFPVEQCRKAIRLAEGNSHIGCKELILQLAASSGIMLTLEG